MPPFALLWFRIRPLPPRLQTQLLPVPRKIDSGNTGNTFFVMSQLYEPGMQGNNCLTLSVRSLLLLGNYPYSKCRVLYTSGVHYRQARSCSEHPAGFNCYKNLWRPSTTPSISSPLSKYQSLQSIQIILPSTTFKSRTLKFPSFLHKYNVSVLLLCTPKVPQDRCRSLFQEARSRSLH
jgi:hypothetical protein